MWLLIFNVARISFFWISIPNIRVKPALKIIKNDIDNAYKLWNFRTEIRLFNFCEVGSTRKFYVHRDIFRYHHSVCMTKWTKELIWKQFHKFRGSICGARLQFVKNVRNISFWNVSLLIKWFSDELSVHQSCQRIEFLMSHNIWIIMT